MSTTPNEVTAKTAGEPNAILSKAPDLNPLPVTADYGPG